MNSLARTIVSTVVGLGLVAFFVVAAFTRGISHDTTVTAFSLLTVYGLLQMAVLSYAPSPRTQVRVVAPAPVVGETGTSRRASVPAVRSRARGSLKPTTAIAA